MYISFCFLNLDLDLFWIKGLSSELYISIFIDFKVLSKVQI